jgi:hypothetical protein
MEENKVMTEEFAENTVQQAYDNLTAAAAKMDEAVALQKATEQAVSATTSKACSGKNLLIGGGCLVAGGIAGYALDHWGIPAIKKGWAKHKEKKAAKKAEKEQKKAAKSGKKPAPAKEEKPAPAPANTPDDGVNPMDIDTTID